MPWGDSNFASDGETILPYAPGGLKEHSSILGPARSSVISHGCDSVLGRTEEIELLTLLDDAPSSPDQLLGQLQGPAGEVAMLLARLEVKGWVTRSGAGYSLSPTGARVRSKSTGVGTRTERPSHGA